MNLHSSVALLNIATEDLLSAGAGVGEHCHLQLGKLQKQGHKSQIRDGTGITAEPWSCSWLDWATFLLEGVDGLSFVLSFSLQMWHFPSCAWRDSKTYFTRIEIVLVKEGLACLLFSSPWTANFKYGKKQGNICSLLVHSGLSGLCFALPC